MILIPSTSSNLSTCSGRNVNQENALRSRREGNTSSQINNLTQTHNQQSGHLLQSNQSNQQQQLNKQQESS